MSDNSTVDQWAEVQEVDSVPLVASESVPRKRVRREPGQNDIMQGMAMYAALLGKPPVIDPQAEEAFVRPPASPIDRLLSTNFRDHLTHLSEGIVQGLAHGKSSLKINGPVLANWLRRHSHMALKRVEESKNRLTKPTNRAA